jgi:hypothetical protein
MKNKEIRVRGFHLDQFGHVNNVRYPEILEEARYDFFDQFPGFFERIQQTGHYLPVTESTFTTGNPPCWTTSWTSGPGSPAWAIRAAPSIRPLPSKAPTGSSWRRMSYSSPST